MAKKDIVFKFLFLLSIIYLLSNALLIRRDYQDTWILEGLEIPFLLFVVTFALAFFSGKKGLWLVSAAAIGRMVFLLIPSLKYVWFQGISIDQFTQYNLANTVVNTGHISTSSNAFPYLSSPLFHILFSTYSIVLNVPVSEVMKYFPVLSAPVYPLLAYAIVKKMELANEKTILKYAVFLSAIPISFEQYEIIGTLFGILLAFIILFLFVAMLKTRDRRYWLICIIFIVALAAAHSVTSVILTGILVLIFVFLKVPFFKSSTYLRSSAVLAVAIISLAWLVFQGGSTLDAISRTMFVSAPAGVTPLSESLPPTFIQLIHANLPAALQTWVVFYGADSFLLVLALIGLVAMLKMRKKLSVVPAFLTLFFGFSLVITVIGVPIGLGATRVLTFDRLLTPFFCGIAIFYLTRKRKWARTLILASIIFLATVELYACQPLIPSANILYKDLPSNVPIGYVNQASSIYQRQAISFALSYVGSSRIASDGRSYNQILGVADTNFMISHVINYYPIDKKAPPEQYDLFFIHVPGKAGGLGEAAPLRTPDIILQTIYNSSIVYSNGESYILSHRYP